MKRKEIENLIKENFKDTALRIYDLDNEDRKSLIAEYREWIMNELDFEEKKSLAGFLKGKKFTYTLPGKKQINIFGSIVIGLNIILVLLVILYLKNQEFHDFVFNVGR